MKEKKTKERGEGEKKTKYNVETGRILEQKNIAEKLLEFKSNKVPRSVNSIVTVLIAWF